MKKWNKIFVVTSLIVVTILLIYNARNTYSVSNLTYEVNTETIKITNDDVYMIIPAFSNVNFLKNNISTNANWYIKNENSEVINENQNIGTNYTIVFEKDDYTKNFIIIVTGDYNNDGALRLDDLTESLKYFSKNLSQDEIKIKRDEIFYVSDYNKDGKLSLVDISGIIKHCYEVIEQDGNNIDVTNVSLNKTSLTLTVNLTDTLIATVSPANATNKTITWSSSDTSIATVDSNGVVKGIKPGTAIITASSNNNMTATVAVTVNEVVKKTETIVVDLSSKARDPFVLVDDDGTYYMYTTGYRCYKNSSGSLKGDWTEIKDFVNIPSDATGCYWAPEVYKYNNAYYMFSTYLSKTTKHRGVAVFKSNSASGPFTMISDGHITPKDNDHIDGTLYMDEDNNPWMVFVGEWTSYGTGTMNVVRLSDDLTKTVGKIKEIFKANSANWNISRVTDGPFVYKNSQNQLLMLWSSNSSGGYSVGIASGSEIDGEWTQKGLFYKKGTISRNMDGGHGMIFKDVDGTMYMAIHSPNSASNNQIEQAIFIPISEDENGNLVINK